MNAVIDTPFETGIQSRVPWADYAAIPALSISRLKELRRSPLHYAYSLMHPKDTKPLTLGKAAHTAVLEPERYERTYAVWGERTESGDLRPRRGKDWEAFKAANLGHELVTADEHDLAFAIQRAVRSNATAMRYLENGDPEVTLQAVLNGRPCRGRVDWLTALGGPVLVGLKTARDCRHFVFGSAAAKLGYHWQWAFYSDLYHAITGTNPKLVEIVVESAPPHAVAVYTITDDILCQGREEYEAAMVRLAECEATGYFPGPQDDEEELTLPTWAYNATDDLAEIGLEN